jgi:hypothetical protein
MKAIISIILSIGLWYLYLIVLEKTIIYFKESIDQGQFTWCCLSIGIISSIHFAFYSPVKG